VKQEKQELFAADRALIQALEPRSKPVCCIQGTTLFRQGDAPVGLFILKSGEANLLMETRVGKPVMCVHAEAGTLLGLPGIIANEPYTMTALVRGGSEVRFVTTGDFEDLIQAEPSLYPMVLKVLAAEVRAARRAIIGN
jgi:CRP-like cAMP-binding protein